MLAQVNYVVKSFFLALILIFLVLAKRLAGKIIYNMTHLVSNGTFNLNSVSQSTARVLASQAEAIIRTGKTWPPQATKRRN